MVSYVGTDDDEHEWFGAVTHQRNVVTVYPNELSVSLELKIQTRDQLREVIGLLEQAWAERRK